MLTYCFRDKEAVLFRDFLIGEAPEAIFVASGVTYYRDRVREEKLDRETREIQKLFCGFP